MKFDRAARKATAAAMLAVLAVAAQAQVLFGKPPTAEEMEKALGLRGQAAAPAGGGMTRGGLGSPAGAGQSRPLLPSQAATPSSDAAGAAQGTADAPAPAGGAMQASTAPAGATGSAAAAPGPAPAVALPIGFDLGSAKVSPGSMSYVDVVGELLKRNPDVRLTVEGHTDALGHPQQNMQLSWDRAVSVYRLLVERHGVEPTRLTPIGKGQGEPLAEGAGPMDPRNRRVQFRLVQQ